MEFHFEELHQAIDRDLLLRAELKDMDAALERALMFLHEQRVIILQQGLAVFRSAMTIRFQPEARTEKYKPPITSRSSIITRSAFCRSTS